MSKKLLDVESTLFVMKRLFAVSKAAKKVYHEETPDYARLTSRVFGVVLAELEVCEDDLEQILYKDEDDGEKTC